MLPKLKYFEEIFKCLLNVYYVLDARVGAEDIAKVSADKAVVLGYYFILKVKLSEPSKKLNRTKWASFLDKEKLPWRFSSKHNQCVSVGVLFVRAEALTDM